MRAVFTGDLLLGDQPLLLGMGIQSRWGEAYASVFQDFCSWHREQHADFLVVNFEGVLVRNLRAFPPSERAMKAPLPALAPLQELGIPVLVSLANNHSMEYGPDAFAEMCQLLEAAGFLVLGLRDDPAKIVRTADTTVGVFAFSTIPALYGHEPRYYYLDSANEDCVERLLDRVRQTKAQCDQLVIYPHWGTEFVTEPSRMQRELASRLVDSGANLIVGAHPHVIQDAYWVNKAPVYFSVGNLVSDYPLEEVRRSAVVVADWTGGTLTTETQVF